MPMKMSIWKWYKLLSEAVKGKALVKGHSPEPSSSGLVEFSIFPSFTEKL